MAQLSWMENALPELLQMEYRTEWGEQDKGIFTVRVRQESKNATEVRQFNLGGLELDFAPLMARACVEAFLWGEGRLRVGRAAQTVASEARKHREFWSVQRGE